MISLVIILIVLACVILAFFILVQNPKGGGLSGTFGNISSQVMGVKQSTDVMEKGTWMLISIVAGLSLVSVMFFQKPDGVKGKQSQTKSAPAAPAKGAKK